MTDCKVINSRVSELRSLIQKADLTAYIINGTDPHNSEYVSQRWRTREWISGFTGSAGTVVITKDKALLWVDSRYFVQAAEQIKGTCFEMMKINGPDAVKITDYLSSKLKKGAKVGIDAQTLTVKENNSYKEKGINIVACQDILETIWTDRPAMPKYPVVKLTDKLCGESVVSKLSRIRNKMKEIKADYSLVSSLDDIAWILNLRGDDIADTPVFLSHLLIGKTDAKLFTPVERFKKIKLEKEAYKVFEYNKVEGALSKIKGTIYYNPENTNMQLFNAMKNAKLIEGREFSTDFKACKNDAELEGMRIAHILDGVAMVNFLALVKSNEYKFTELSIAQALSDEREMEKDYLGPSFETIAGFKDHGAVVHYSATKETDKAITGSGLLVLDSGGQYVCGTTDITRTLLFGKATKEQKTAYTAVLKGHLALAAAVFPEGTTGSQLDVLAHQELWKKGYNYYHGTGHGVGFRLAVHEGPQNISTKQNDVVLKNGMVVSDEPGVYLEGKFGIRIENLIAVTGDDMHSFEVLTCCPYERDLIDKSMLNPEEVEMVNSYHKWVYEMLKDMVEPEAKKYLRSATAKI